MLEAPKPITIKVARMGDYADECQRIWDNKTAEQAELQKRVKEIADSLFNAEFKYIDFVDAMADADQENAEQLMKLARSDDDAELGRMVKALLHAYSVRCAEMYV